MFMKLSSPRWCQTHRFLVSYIEGDVALCKGQSLVSPIRLNTLGTEKYGVTVQYLHGMLSEIQYGQPMNGEGHSKVKHLLFVA